MSERDLLSEARDGVLRVTFNRPQARNAFTFAMYDELAALCRAADTDPAIRAILLRGEGGRAFASGTDITQFRAFDTEADALAYEERIGDVLDAIETCGKPVIAAIAGACTGGGCAIAAASDLRIAAEGSRFGFPIARTLGNCLSTANYARLVALVGPARVVEMIFTARLLDAAEARTVGLISEVLPDEAAVIARGEELARLVAGNAPLTLRATKEAVRRLRPRLSSGEGDDLVLMCYMSRDFREGMEAFLAKRKPEWTGA